MSNLGVKMEILEDTYPLYFSYDFGYDDYSCMIIYTLDEDGNFFVLSEVQSPSS